MLSTPILSSNAYGNNQCGSVLPASASTPDPLVNITSDLSADGSEAHKLKDRDVQPSDVTTTSSPQPGTPSVVPYISDPLIEKINNTLGASEVEQLIKLRKSRRPQNRRAMTAIMDKQKQNLSIALKEIEKKYSHMEPAEHSILKKLDEEIRGVDHIDDFVLLCTKYSLVATFLHQKYYSPFPQEYVKVNFRPGVSCQQIFDLPYRNIIENSGVPQNNEPGTFYYEFSRCVDHTDVFDVESINRLLKEPQLLVLYPEFDALAEPFFLQCIPLGFYPLGLTEKPYIEADGFLLSPAHFFFHDLLHANKIEKTEFLKDKANLKGMRLLEAIYLQLINDVLDSIKEDKELHSSLTCVLFCKNHEYGKKLRDIFKPEGAGQWHEVFDQGPFNPIKSRKDIEAYLWLNGFIEYINQYPSLDAVLDMHPNALVRSYMKKRPVSQDDVSRLYAWKKLSESGTHFLAQLLRDMNWLANIELNAPWANTANLDILYENPEPLLQRLKKMLNSGSVNKDDVPREFLDYYSDYFEFPGRP